VKLSNRRSRDHAAGGGQLARRSVPKAGAILVHKLPGPCQRAFHFFRDERLATLPQVTPTKWRAPPQGKRRNQATAARTFGIKRIDAGTAMPKILAGARLACELHHTQQMRGGVKQERHSVNTRADLSSAQMRRAR